MIPKIEVDKLQTITNGVLGDVKYQFTFPGTQYPNVFVGEATVNKLIERLTEIMRE